MYFGKIAASGLTIALALASWAVEAAVCTTQSAGNWGTASTWDCGHVPDSSDTAVVAHDVTLSNDDTVAGLTINAGATLTAGNNDDLTVTGNVVINGTYSSNGERLYMTGAGATISGNGTIDDTRIYIDALNVTLSAGSTIAFVNDAYIRVGNNDDASLTIDGTVDGTGQPGGSRILRVENNNAASVTINGTIDAPNSYVEVEGGRAVVNNGSVSLDYIEGTSSSVWTQGGNSNLTLDSAPTGGGGWQGTLNASANGNTVAYNSGTPYTPSSNTYYNLVWPGAVCPVSYIILGSSPCTPAAPSAVTDAATAITGVGATLNGTVSSNNAATTVTFEYGLTTAYGDTAIAAESPLASSASNSAVSSAITGLSCNTQYHYRVRAENSAGTTYGSDVTFTTSSCSASSSPSVCVNDTSVGTYAWTGLGNVGASDNTYAQADGLNGSTTNYLKCTGYNFNIPSNAVITGITLGIERYSPRTFYDAYVRLVRADAIQTDVNYADGATSYMGGETTATYGGASDLWGAAWTAADVNDPGFGAALAAQRGPYNTTSTAYVDHMPITVDYTVPPGPTVTAITRDDASPTNASSVSWTVTFSESVTGVAAGNFSLTTDLAGTPAITSVTGSGSSWTVTASTGTGDGTLRLDMANSTGVTNGSGEAVANLPFITGESYTLDRTAPLVSSIARAGATPTSELTVSWTVTFSESVSGLTAGNFSLATDLSGTPSILSVTGSGTSWTVAASTGSGTGSLGLDMVTSTGVADAVGNTVSNVPFVGEVYTVDTDTRCITEDFATGVLDADLWEVRTINGPYLPQVVDAGGGDYRLRLTDTQNNEATFAQLKRSFPGYGNKIVLEIDYFAGGGSGADGIAMTLSDSSISSTTGGFGGSLGYAQRTGVDGFGGGWLGIGLDEYGNYPNPTEGRTGYPAGWTAPAPADQAAGFDPRSVAIRGSGSGQTGYPLLANTGTLANGVTPADTSGGATPYRYRFTVDHSDNTHAYVTVEQDTTGTGSSYSELVPTFDIKGYSGQAEVPPRWLVSFTGSTGGATNNHDFKRVQVCANTISTSMTGPDHFEIEHASGTGITCNPTTLTVKACEDVACTIPYTAGVSGTLTATGTPTVNWGDGADFSIPAGASSVVEAVHVTTAGTVVFDATSPDAASPATCNFGGSSSCTFTAADSGFLVSAPNHAAETTSTLTVQAVKTADNSLACVPAFGNETKSVNLKCTYSDPGTGTGTLPIRVAGTALNATNDAGAACDGSGASVSLDFDGTGVATPDLQYADVGRMAVTATLTGTTGALDEGLAMTGGGSFVVMPDHFVLSAIQQTAGPNLANPAAGAADGTKFVKAGEAFSVTVTAKNAAGATTPNFGQETEAESVVLTSALVLPAGGTDPGVTGSFGAFSNGVATGTDFAWDEVGIITLTPSIAPTAAETALGQPGSYLGAGDVTGTASGNVGRFYADHFDVSVTGGTFNAANGTFTYLGQSFTYDTAPTVTITARSAGGGQLQNYEGDFWKLGTTLTDDPLAVSHYAYGDMTGATLAAVPTADIGFGDTSNANGARTLNSVHTDGGFTYTRPDPATTPTAPFDADIQLAVTVQDTDGAAGTAAARFGFAAIDGESNAGQPFNATNDRMLRHGLGVLSDVYGTYGLNGDVLNMPLDARYYDGASWVLNTDDSSSIVTASADAGCAASVTPTVASPAVGGGLGSVTLTINAVGGFQGGCDISLDSPAWLLPGSATATFGIFRSDDRFLYWQEQ